MRAGSLVLSLVTSYCAAVFTPALASPIPISNVTQGASWTRLTDGSWQPHAAPHAAARGGGMLAGVATVAVYDNTTTSQAQAFTQGPAAGAAPTFTRMVADDLTLDAASFIGDDIREITFSVFNGNTVPLSFRPLVRIYQTDGAGGNPGTLAGGFDLNPVLVPANTSVLLSFDPGAGVLAVPINQKFWAGVTFDNLGGTASSAQMDNVGQALFDPPTVGSSDDIAFETTNAGSFLSNNPPGALFDFDPLLPAARANFAVAMRVVAPKLPEPGTGLLALAGVWTLAARHRSRRNRDRDRRPRAAD